MRDIPLAEAQQRLPDLLDAAAEGAEVIISRGDGAAFRLIPVIAPTPVFGSARGRVRMSDDFDAPVEGFEPYAP